MGYTTDFEGQFKTNRPLTETEMNYINKFSDTRRVKRDSVKLMEKYKGEFGHPTRELDPYGKDGEFFVGGHDWPQDDTIIDYNTAPGQLSFNDMKELNDRYSENQNRIVNGHSQPGLWCQWRFTDETTLEWDGGEKFYNYVEWLNYLIYNFFKDWGIELSGEVKWYGEDSSDKGKIVLENNKMKVFVIEETYKEI